MPPITNTLFWPNRWVSNWSEGSDLVAANGRIMMRTTKGFEPVDVLYRRIDDDFLDPEVFRSDSLLGVPGLMEIYKKGRVALANRAGHRTSPTINVFTPSCRKSSNIISARKLSFPMCRPMSARSRKSWRTSLPIWTGG